MYIPPFVYGHLGYFHLLAIVNKLVWTFTHKILGVRMFSILLGRYLGVEVLGHIVTVCLIFCQSIFQRGCAILY